MNISVLIPTRGRDKGLAHTINKLNLFAADRRKIEYIIKKDTDDPIPVLTETEQGTIICSHRLKGYWSLHNFYNAMAALSRGKWLWMFNDDAWTETPGWDEKVMACGDGDKIAKCLVPDSEWPTAPSQGHYDHYHKIIHPEFPLVSRRLYEASGHFSMSYAADTWWRNIYDKLPVLRQDVPITVFHTYERAGMKPAYLDGEVKLSPHPDQPDHDGPETQQQVLLEIERLKVVLGLDVAQDKA